MKLKKYYYLILFLVSLVACIIGHMFWVSIMSFIKWIFNIPNLNFYAGGIALLMSLIVRIKENKILLSNHVPFDNFKQIIEEISSYFTGGSIMLMCSISLAKGLFFQWRGLDQYFKNFEEWELLFISFITLYLLFISIQEVVKDFKKLLPSNKEFTPEPIEKPTL